MEIYNSGLAICRGDLWSSLIMGALSKEDEQLHKNPNS